MYVFTWKITTVYTALPPSCHFPALLDCLRIMGTAWTTDRTAASPEMPLKLLSGISLLSLTGRV